MFKVFLNLEWKFCGVFRVVYQFVVWQVWLYGKLCEIDDESDVNVVCVIFNLDLM